MANLPKKVIERYKNSMSKFQKVLKIAQDRDINEADTVSIIQDILAEVFGYQKYIEITSEYAIRNMFCDLAIKMNDKIQFLIEVKAVGLTLKEQHLRQVIEYGVNKGVQWVVLTNGINWELYKIRFERPVEHDLVTSFSFLDINYRKLEDQNKLYLLTKEGVGKSVREDFYERVQSVNRFVIGSLVVSEPVINIIKRDIRKLATGIKVESDEIEKILKNEVLKRDVIEGDEALKAKQKIVKINKKSLKKNISANKKKDNTSIKNLSVSERLLRDRNQ